MSEPTHHIASPAVSVRGLVKRYGEVEAVRGSALGLWTFLRFFDSAREAGAILQIGE